MKTYIDQTGREINLKEKPKRIISIVPSQSEFIWDIGVRDELVGITKFCIHPNEMFTSITRVGGTKKLNIEKIRELNPDLIIGNKEENERSQIEELQKEFNVWMSDIYDLEDSFEMMNSIGEMCGKEKKSEEIIEKIKQNFSKLKINNLGNKKAAYFIWYDPFMAAANNTFIDFMLRKLGMINVFGNMDRYPELNTSQIKNADPELILLSSEPFPFNEKHMKELQKICPKAKIILVDGEMFSWYGSHLIQAPEYFSKLNLSV